MRRLARVAMATALFGGPALLGGGSASAQTSRQARRRCAPSAPACNQGSSVAVPLHTWPILNLGMGFSNKGGVRLNLSTMDRFVSMIMLVVKLGRPTARVVI
jgi:hypothetical protein